MKSVCKNCNNTFDSKYCGQCGQDSHTHQINGHFLWHDIQHGFFHFDKGILFTLKELFTRPGFAIKEYLNGKRVKHFKPVSLIIILAGIWSLLYHYMPVTIQENISEGASLGTKIKHWLSDHYSIAELINLPFYALASFFVFKTYNYLEHIVINAFIIAQKIVVGIIFLPILFSIKDSSAQIIVSVLLDIVSFMLLLWSYSQIFNFHSKVKVLLISALVYLFLFAETLMIRFILTHI